MAEIGSRKGSRDNIAGLFQLQSRLTSSAILEDAPQHHAVAGIDVALGHPCKNLLTLERCRDEVWKLLDAVAQEFTAGQKRSQQCKHSTGAGVGLGSGNAALRPGMTEQGMLSRPR